LCLNGSRLEAEDDGEGPQSGWLLRPFLPKIAGRQENAAHSALQRAQKWLRLNGSVGQREKERRLRPSLFLRCLVACGSITFLRPPAEY